MNLDYCDRISKALYAANREVRKAHDEIARLKLMLDQANKTRASLYAHIGRLQDMLLHEGRPIPQCQQRTGDSTI